MRIIKETSLQDIKVTILVMNGKYSLKLEKDLLEQTYKFRDGSGIDSAGEIESMFTSEFYDKANAIFNHMSAVRWEAINKGKNQEDEFEIII